MDLFILTCFRSFVEVFPDAGNILMERQVKCSRIFIFLRTNPRFTLWRAAFLFPHRGQPSTTVLAAPETFLLCKYKNKSHLIVQFKPGTFYLFLTSQTSLLFDKCTEVRNAHTHTCGHIHPQKQNLTKLEIRDRVFSNTAVCRCFFCI